MRLARRLRGRCDVTWIDPSAAVSLVRSAGDVAKPGRGQLKAPPRVVLARQLRRARRVALGGRFDGRDLSVA